MSVLVNQREITEEMIKAEMERLRPQYEQTFADMEEDKRNTQLYNWSKENIIEQLLIRQAAEKAFPNISDEQIEQAYNNLKQQNPSLPENEKENINASIKTQLQIEQLIEIICRSSIHGIICET